MRKKLEVSIDEDSNDSSDNQNEIFSPTAADPFGLLPQNTFKSSKKSELVKKKKSTDIHDEK